MRAPPVGEISSVLALVVPTIALGLASTPVSAQSTNDGDAPGLICMASAASEGEQLLIVLPPRNVSSMLGKGFEVVPCNKAFPTPADRERWRDSICELAALPLEHVQEMFASDHGVRAQELCGMAELATSQWQKQRASEQ